VTEKATQRRPGRRASDEAALHRRMRQQSLKTSWRNLAEACEQMIEWRSFALWVRAIVGAERSLPQWLREAIDQRCPRFLESRSEAADLDSLWLDLSTWIAEHIFAVARTGGWIEALHYYSGRDPRSEQLWLCWEHTETSWCERKPTRYPTADEWHQDALKHDSPRAESAELVAQYIEWEAFALWARLITERESELPSDVAAAIEQRCPGFLGAVRSEKPGPIEYSTWFWRRLLAWIETHVFSDASKAPSLDVIRNTARTHLRGERIAEYWAYCSSRWQSPPIAYPDSEQWLQHADVFVVE
jgi:hypothetical protein